MRRARFLLPLLAFAACAMGRAEADDLFVTEKVIPIEVNANGDPNTSSIFRNELTQVDVTDERSAASDFDGMSKQTVTSGSGLALRQKIGDRLLFQATTKVGVAQNGMGSAGAVGSFNQDFQGQSAANQAAFNQTLSSESRWSADWNPTDTVSVSYASSSTSELDDDRTLAEVLSADTTFSAKWRADGKTTLTLSNDQQKSYDWGTLGYDGYETTALSLSRNLTPNLTWNASPGWLRDTSGGTNPYQMAGPQLSTSFDWAPVQGTKWTVGGAWNRLEETDQYSSEPTGQTTRSVFVAYDRALGKNLRLQLRSDYSNLDAPRATAANVAQQEQFSVRAGQKYSLTDTFSARFDVSQCFQQQDRQAWATSESMATISIQKNF